MLLNRGPDRSAAGPCGDRRSDPPDSPREVRARLNLLRRGVPPPVPVGQDVSPPISIFSICPYSYTSLRPPA